MATGPDELGRGVAGSSGLLEGGQVHRKGELCPGPGPPDRPGVVLDSDLLPERLSWAGLPLLPRSM